MALKNLYQIIFMESRLPMNAELYTIGHSAHPFRVFLELLGIHGVTAVADVRSVPYCLLQTKNGRSCKQEIPTFEVG